MNYEKVIESRHDEPCNLSRRSNFALVTAYFSVGFVGSFIHTPLNVYLVKSLYVEGHIQNTISICLSLPWSFKLIFGAVSDAVPIYGRHRKPYLTMGALLYSAAFVSYSLMAVDNVVLLAGCIFSGTMGLICLDVMADTMCVERSKFEEEAVRGQMQATCYSIRFGGSLLGAILGALVCNSAHWGWGLTFRQVALVNGLVPLLLVTPWLVCLREKYHRCAPDDLGHCHGHRHSDDRCRSTRSEGGGVEMVSGLRKYKSSVTDGDDDAEVACSSKITSCSTSTNTTIATSNTTRMSSSSRLVNAAASGKAAGAEDTQSKTYSSTGSSSSALRDTTKPLTATAADDDDGIDDTAPLTRQFQQVWSTVQLQAVWRPMAFVFLYNITQLPNVAWQSFLQLDLHFEPWILGLTAILCSFMTFAGVLAYKYLFFKASWRSIYAYSMLLTTFFSLLQLLLVFRVNQSYFHLNNVLFSLGDDVLSTYVHGIQMLPICNMYMSLCPEGAEGTSYSMLTTFGNIALVCAASLGNLLSGAWDVSNEAMRADDVGGLWKLSLLTSVLSLLPIGFLFLLPKSADEQARLAKSQVRSRVGGGVFLLVLFGSLAWTVSQAVGELSTVWGKGAGRGGPVHF